MTFNDMVTPMILFAAVWIALAADPLDELKTLAGTPDAKSTATLDADQINELLAKRARRALAIVTQMEKDEPISTHLNAARLLALRSVSHVEALATDREPIALAKRLRAASKPGTDHAAEADLFLVGADIRTVLRASGSSDDFKAAWDKNAKSFRTKIVAYLADHPKYTPAADALRALLPYLDLAGDRETRELVIDHIVKNLPDHPVARAAALKRSLGKELELTFTPIGADKSLTLKDFRGKVIVVNFWASWCVPCIAEVAHLKTLLKKYDGRLEIIGVSLDERDAAAKRHIDRHKPGWAQVIGKEARAIGTRFGIETVPLQLVIDKDGKLHAIDTTGQLDEVLEKMLSK